MISTLRRQSGRSDSGTTLRGIADAQDPGAAPHGSERRNPFDAVGFRRSAVGGAPATSAGGGVTVVPMKRSASTLRARTSPERSSSVMTDPAGKGTSAKTICRRERSMLKPSAPATAPSAARTG